MVTMYSKYPYILAIIFGSLVPIIPNIESFPVAHGLIYFLGGGLFGYLRPKESWRWGLWMVGPIFGLIGLSIAFSGQFDVFLKKDLPLLVISIMSACLGSFLLARIKLRQAKK